MAVRKWTCGIEVTTNSMVIRHSLSDYNKIYNQFFIGHMSFSLPIKALIGNRDFHMFSDIHLYWNHRTLRTLYLLLFCCSVILSLWINAELLVQKLLYHIMQKLSKYSHLNTDMK